MQDWCRDEIDNLWVEKNNLLSMFRSEDAVAQQPVDDVKFFE